MRGRKKITKVHMAKIAAMHELGHSNRKIGRACGLTHNTVAACLKNQALLSDPKVQELIRRITEQELNDLTLLGGRGRERLHQLFDEGKMAAIPALAVVDRTFGERQLLMNRPTSVNVVVYADLIRMKREKEEELRKLESETGNPEQN